MAAQRTALLLLLGLATLAGGLRAQTGDEWDSQRVLTLVQRGREARRSQSADSTFRQYRARADGYVYFYLDRPDDDERTLVKTDQIAVDVFWEAPNRAGQRIVGLRDEKSLPTNINYHIDHLTVVQDDFGDRIRLGEGDEVGAVPHPLASGSEGVYHFALGDSITIRYGSDREVRVYEIRVRPREYEQPGFIGSVFVDRASAAIVRMNFTFTPASYVDPYLDYIRISLDNSLWMGRHWLPYRQEVELRRELPILDFLAGSVIRGRWGIADYDFDQGFPESFSRNRRVDAVPLAERRAFSFQRGLYDDLDEAGLQPSPALETVEAEARRIVSEQLLSGLSPVRLYGGSGSDFVRHNRAEGLFLGGGLTLRPRGDVRVRTRAGYAFGRSAGTYELSATGGTSPRRPEVELWWDRVRDIGLRPAVSGLIASSSSLGGNEDFVDPWLSRGFSISLAGAESETRATFRWEDHRSARDVVSDAPGNDRRVIRSIDEGVMGAFDLDTQQRLPGGGSGEVSGTIGRLRDRTFARLWGRGEWGGIHRASSWSWSVRSEAGWASGDSPAQALFLLGGRGTLPGHEFRRYEGDRFGSVAVEVSRPVLSPWLSVRLLAGAGISSLSADRVLPAGWTAQDTDGPIGFVGAGFALGWESIRFDLVRGAPDGRWEFVMSFSPGLSGWL